MYKIQSIDDLKTLIADATEESTELEFKLNFGMPEDEIIIIDKDKQGKKKKDWKTELAKDVSAMANSAGGTIIFGISEEKNENDKNIASELVPISNSKMDKDRLTRLLIENIRPEICFEITHIKAESENAGFFIVNIPQGTTAYQNKRDHRYYIRHNAIVESMEDYQIRDIMNRIKEPLIDLEFYLVRTKVYPRKNLLGMKGVKNEKLLMEGGYAYSLHYKLVNKGPVYAKYINYFIFVPQTIIKDGNYTCKDGCVVLYGENREDNIGYTPLVPHMKSKEKSISLDIEDEVISNDVYIEYEIHADNSEVRRMKIKLCEIKCENKEGWKDEDFVINEDIKEKINSITSDSLLRADIGVLKM